MCVAKVAKLTTHNSVLILHICKRCLANWSYVGGGGGGGGQTYLCTSALSILLQGRFYLLCTVMVIAYIWLGGGGGEIRV